MTSKETLLIIDDSDEDYETLKWIFRKIDFNSPLVRAISGAQALQLLTGPGLPALILLDLNLPDISGQELLNTIKQNPRLKVVPVVVMTTSSNPLDINLCYESGASGYVVKPVNLRLFTHVIKLVIEYWFEAVKLPE